MLGLILYLLAVPNSYAAPACVRTLPNSLSDVLSALETAQAPIQLDPTLLRKWDSNARLPCDPPFLVTYQKNGRTLSFIASAHLSEPAEPETSIIKVYKNLIEAAKPKGVLIEADTHGLMSEGSFTREQEAHCYQGKKFVCGEPIYSAYSAHAIGAAVWGGEPNSQELNQALSQKVSREDLLGFNSVQRVLMFQREGIPLDQWSQLFAKELQSDISFDPKEWSYQKFSKWIQSKIGKKPIAVESDWLNPSGSNPIQKTSGLVEEIREPLILKSAESLINQYNPALIIYGAGHYYNAAPAFEKAFGPPKVECLR